MSRRRAVYDPSGTQNSTIRLKARNMSALESAQFQDPGYAGIPVFFLGLFDVTRCCAVAVGTVLALFGPVWHCFDLTAVLY